ncbi:MAG: hypothetical protein V3T84_12520 [Phycisphaerales bacterium]
MAVKLATFPQDIVDNLLSIESRSSTGRISADMPLSGMPKRSSKRDANEVAESIVDQVADDVDPKEEPAEPEKNPAAVALGRLGVRVSGQNPQ